MIDKDAVICRAYSKKRILGANAVLVGSEIVWKGQKHRCKHRYGGRTLKKMSKAPHLILSLRKQARISGFG